MCASLLLESKSLGRHNQPMLPSPGPIIILPTLSQSLSVCLSDVRAGDSLTFFCAQNVSNVWEVWDVSLASSYTTWEQSQIEQAVVK
jgi:hypothetical protein